MGATKTAVALATVKGRLLAECRYATPQSLPKAAIAVLIAHLKALLQRRRLQVSSLRAIGVGVPGVCDPRRGVVVWVRNLKGWRRVPLARALRTWARCPVELANDGDMAALGERWRGAGRGCSHLVTLTVGTGIGGGVIANGQLVRGASYVAGAVGWMRVHPSTGLRASGGRLEDLASGMAILRRFLRVSRTRQLLGLPATTERICRAASAGHPLARRVVREAAEALGIAAVNLVNALNPQAVVFGGGVMDSAGKLMLPVIRQAVRRHALPMAARHVRVLLSPLGSRAGLLGAVHTAQKMAVVH